MKLKKLISALVASAIAVTSMVMPISAAAQKFEFSESAKAKYALKVTASLPVYATFEMNDSINLSYSSKVDGFNAKVTEATFLGNKLTKNTATAAYFGGENSFAPVAYTTMEWVGLVELSDTSKHPVDDLKINLNTSNLFQIALTFYVKNNAALNGQTGQMFVNKVEVVNTASNSYLRAGSQIKVSEYMNSGFGFTRLEKASLKVGQDYQVIVDLATPLSSSEFFTFKTDLVTKTVSVYGSRGDRQIVFDKVDPTYFYNAVLSDRYGIDYLFETMTIAGGYEYSKVTILFNEGTGSSSNNTGSEPEEEETKAPPASSAYINYPTITLNPGASAYLVTDMDTTGLSRTTTSRNICRVFTSGRIEAQNAGTATITIKNSKGEVAYCNVTVKNSSNPTTSFELSTKSGTIYKGFQYSLAKSTKSPSSTTDTITWSSSDPSIATVDQNGKVVVKGTGKVAITAITSNGLTSTANMTAKAPGVTISSGTSKTIKVGKTHTIKAKAGPSSGKLTYSTSNSSVAKVSTAGVVTGVKKGTATITVKSSKGGSSTVKITVS